MTHSSREGFGPFERGEQRHALVRSGLAPLALQLLDPRPSLGVLEFVQRPDSV